MEACDQNHRGTSELCARSQQVGPFNSRSRWLRASHTSVLALSAYVQLSSTFVNPLQTGRAHGDANITRTIIRNSELMHC
jgi:hypothetical protein